MRIFLPIFILGISGALFMLFIDPTYMEVKALQEEQVLLNKSLSDSKQISASRDELVDKLASFPLDDLDRLKKMLPDNVDNVRLVRDLDGIAARYGMSLRNVSVKLVRDENETLGPSSKNYGVVTLTFSVSGSYKTFISFLRDLERSLRIIDVETIKFTASERDLYEYTVGIKTYWLKTK